MTWGFVAAGAATVAGSALSGRSARDASRSQANASAAALAGTERQYDLARSDLEPYRNVGGPAVNRLAELAQQYQTAIRPMDVTSDPGYQFGLTEGMNALEGSAAARGGLYSGATMKALQRYGNDYATTKYNQAYNRIAGERDANFGRFNTLTNIGQNSAAGSAVGAQNFGNAQANILQSQGDATAAGQIAQGNINSNALNQLGGMAFQWRGGGSGGAQPTANWNFGGQPALTTGDFSRMDRAGGYADGGRVQPKVGTRTPLPGASTGGGLSREAILAALDAAQQPQQQAPYGIAALPADPLRNPGAIVRDRERQAGSYSSGGMVQGPGGPRDDVIPANLSNGEHVMDVRTVRMLGRGSIEQGHQMLNKLRAMARH